MSSPKRIRYSLQFLQELYDGNNPVPLETLVRAFKGIQDLPPENPNSFFVIAGWHGLPFSGPGEWEKESDWWGGYCWHGSAPFSTWHRGYVHRLESALRSIPGCQDVTLPFWDELVDPPQPQDGTTTAKIVIPSVLTSEIFKFKTTPEEIKNPLYSYKLRAAIFQYTVNEEGLYSKPKEYETVRYPLSGLVGTPSELKTTDEHNKKYQDNPKRNAEILNHNVSEWLNESIYFIPPDGHGTPRPQDIFNKRYQAADLWAIRRQYMACLNEPQFTVFSNATSEGQWNKDHPPHKKNVNRLAVSLETPHNAVHLSIGGFYIRGIFDADVILGANGDMGDNETAAFDPIFWFHHGFIDYVFAAWQQKWGLSKRGSLTLFGNDYPGTVINPAQNVPAQPPNLRPGTKLTTTLPLPPLELTPDDVTDTVDLDYNYSGGSLGKYFLPVSLGGVFPPIGPEPVFRDHDSFVLTKRVYNISRADYLGSFVVILYAKGSPNSEERKDSQTPQEAEDLGIVVGRHPVLSRSNVKRCANCQNHLDVEFLVPIEERVLDYLGGDKGKVDWKVHIQGRLVGKKSCEPEVDDL